MSYQKIVKIYIILCAICTGIIITAVIGLQPPNQLEIYFLDVGQGDAILIRTPYGHNIIVDGGRDNLVSQRLGSVLPYFVRTIDLMILTHPDSDHTTGLVELFNRYQIEHVAITGVQHKAAGYQALLGQIGSTRVHTLFVPPTRVIPLGPGLKLEFIAPLKSVKDQTVEIPNNTSIVTKITYGDVTVLLTGDAHAKIEAQLIKQGKINKVDILQLGHHGSKTSSSQEFLLATLPQLAIISVGQDNSYGHPAPVVIDRLDKLEIDWLATSQQGTIVILTDGKEISVK